MLPDYWNTCYASPLTLSFFSGGVLRGVGGVRKLLVPRFAAGAGLLPSRQAEGAVAHVGEKR